MVTDLIDAISTKLYDEYGITIYVNDVKQGLRTPCFLISIIQPSIISVIPPRQLVRNPIVVQYVSDSHKSKKELIDLGFELSQLLEYVTTVNGDLLRGTNRAYEIAEDILNFYIDYDFYIKTVDEAEKMNELDSEVNIKNE